jgi:hypothetical protein
MSNPLICNLAQREAWDHLIHNALISLAVISLMPDPRLLMPFTPPLISDQLDPAQPHRDSLHTSHPLSITSWCHLNYTAITPLLPQLSPSLAPYHNSLTLQSLRRWSRKFMDFWGSLLNSSRICSNSLSRDIHIWHSTSGVMDESICYTLLIKWFDRNLNVFDLYCTIRVRYARILSQRTFITGSVFLDFWMDLYATPYRLNDSPELWVDWIFTM